MSFQFRNTISLAWKRLKAGEYTIKSFEANKLWEFTTDTAVDFFYKNYDINVYRALYPENHKYIGNITNLSSSLYSREFTTQSLDPKLLWYYLDHNYYTEYDREKIPGTITDDSNVTYLWESSSMFVFPMNLFGEGIRKKTFQITNLSTTSSYQYTLKDDGYGNLIDTSFDESKFVGDSHLMMYIGFNEKYREYNFKNKKLNYVMDMSSYKNEVDIRNQKNIIYQPGIPTTDTSESSGVSAVFNGSSLSVKDSNVFNFNRGRNFAFSFWINLPDSQPTTNFTENSIFAKNAVEDVYYKSENTLELGNIVEVVKNQEQYPFDISVTNQSSGNPKRIIFRQSSEVEKVEVVSSELSSSTWHHIVCQKSGSNYEIWIDGTLSSSENKIITRNVMNNSKFFISDDGTGNKKLSGSLDEIRIYNKPLTSTEISYLGNNSIDNGYAYQTSRVGNVFYKTGMAVISDPRPKYKNAFLGQTGNFDHNILSDGFYGKFRGTTTIHEYEIICKIRKNEFNFTQNPSVLKEKDMGSFILEDYVTSSFFNPYVTTIGLYNDERELLAVAKLANPLEKRDDVDMNIIVRFDM